MVHKDWRNWSGEISRDRSQREDEEDEVGKPPARAELERERKKRSIEEEMKGKRKKMQGKGRMGKERKKGGWKTL